MKKQLFLLALMLLSGDALTAATTAPQAASTTSRILNGATSLYDNISLIHSDEQAVKQLENDLLKTENLSNTDLLSEKLQTIGEWLEDGRRNFFGGTDYDYMDLFDLTPEHKRDLERQGIQTTAADWWANARSGIALNRQGSRNWLSNIMVKPGADREASEYWHSNEYYGRRKKRIAIFRAAKRLYELEKALKEQRAYLADMRGRIALEREATAAEAANKKALSLADVEGQLAVAEANRKAKEEEDKAKQERIKDKGKVIVDQIKAQGDASAQIATIQQPTLLAQHKETVAADKLKHDATLLADKEQQEARLKARKSLVQLHSPSPLFSVLAAILPYVITTNHDQRLLNGPTPQCSAAWISGVDLRFLPQILMLLFWSQA